MSDLTSSATPEGASGAAGGMPAESDLPALQGLDEAADDSSDDQAPSDPMPDVAGSSGT